MRDGVVFSASRELQAKGELSAAAAVLAAHLRAHPGAGEEALELARTYANAGHINLASEVLDQLPPDHGQPGLRLRIAMQRLHLTMIQNFDVATSAVAADRLWQAFEDARIADVERADAARIRCCILREAAKYGEIGRNRADEALTALGVAAGTLLDRGWIDEGLRAALDLADCQVAANRGAGAYLIFASDARRLQRGDLAGEALLRHAEALMQAGAPMADISAIMSDAKHCFAIAKHDLGGIDAALVDARLRTRRLNSAPSELEDVLQAYESHAVPGRSLAVALELASLARRRHDMEAARRYRQTADSISNTSGLHLQRAAGRVSEAEECIGVEEYLKAIQLGKDGLKTRMPRQLRGSVEAAMAAACALSGNSAGVRQYCDALLLNFESLPGADLAFVAVERIAARSLTLNDEALLQYLIGLLLRHADGDAQRADHAAASRKHRLRAQLALKLHRLLQTHGQSTKLGEAESAIASAVSEAELLSGVERAEAFGDIAKLSGQIAVLSNDAARASRAYSNAIDIYENAGRSEEAARCRLITGSLHARSYAEALRRGQTDIALRHSADARTTFESVRVAPVAGIEQARACRMLAQLCLAADDHDGVMPEPAKIQALAYLADAEWALDGVRNRSADPSTTSQASLRRTIADESQHLYSTAVRLLKSPADAEQLWRWNQKSRARALRDAIPSHGVTHHGAALDRDVARILDAYQDLTARFAPNDAYAKAERQRLLKQMEHHPGLTDYVEFSACAEPKLDGMRAVIEHNGADRLAVVDLILSENSIGVQGLTLSGLREPVRLRADAGLVRHLLDDWSDWHTLRQKLEGRSSPLRDLDAIVEPLARMTSQGDSIVLCPSGPLSALPLHAAAINGAPLLTRNTVTYAQSAALWRRCAMRERSGSLTPASVFADPLSDQPRQRIAGERLAARLGVSPASGAPATRERAITALRGSSIVVFQGPVVMDLTYPDRSKIVFSDGALGAGELSQLELHTNLVVLGGFEEVSHASRPYRDLPGLAAALLRGGVRTVVMPLWPVDASDAGDMLELFIHNLAASPNASASAALRRTQMQLMALPAFASPFHWACWTIHGAA